MFLIPLLLADTKSVVRTNLTGCYDDTTSLKLNRNTYTLQLGLNPTNKTECHALEESVLVNLTLHANGYLCDNITLMLENFTYQNTTSLEFNFYKDKNNIYNIDDVFCDANLPEDDRLQGLPDITFGFVEIYTHSHLISTEIMQYSQVKTNVSGCFSNIFALMADNYSMMLTTTPTLVCKNLMTKKPETGTSDNYISAMELIFGENSFILDDANINAIIDGYASQTVTTIELQDEPKVMKIAESDTQNAELKITSVENNVPVYILYNIEYSQASVRPFFINTIFTASKDEMFFKYDADKAGVEDVNTDESEPFSSYMVKLIIMQGSEYITYQKEFEKNEYDPLDNIWVIECDTMVGFEKEECQNYSEYLRTSSDAKVRIFVAFYNDEGEFIFHEETDMTQHLACISDLDVRYIDNSFISTNYILVNNSMCAKYENYTITGAYLLVAYADYRGSLKDLYLTNDSITSFVPVEFRCTDGEPCNLNKDYIQFAEKSPVALEIFLNDSKQNRVVFTVVANKLTLQNDMLVSYPAIGLGMSSLAGCIILTLYGIVMTMKRVKMIKKRKLEL